MEGAQVAAAERASVDVGVVLEWLSGVPDGMRTSLQKDLEARRPVELEAISGPNLCGGEAHGIPTPATRELAYRVAARTRGR